MDNQTNLNLQRLKELSQLIDIGEEVKKTLDTDGWKLILEPMLNKMITDVMGGIENGRWHNGSLDELKLGEEEAKVLIAYKRALVDLHKYIYQYVDPLPQLHEEYNQILKEESHPEESEVKTGYEGKD